MSKRAFCWITLSLLLTLQIGSVRIPASAESSTLSAGAANLAPAWTARGNQEYAWYGFDVGAAGDVNGDGYDDVIVGAPYYSHDEYIEGAVFAYYGSDGGPSAAPDWVFESDRSGTELGRTVGTAGDVNGDGYDDVVVGTEFYSYDYLYGGAVWVYYGSENGLGAAADWFIEGEGEEALLGARAGCAGDVNGDGVDDLIVSAYGLNGGRGRVYVYHGSDTGLSQTPAWTADGEQAQGRFGLAVAAAGDVNGDGYDDVLVGESGYDGGQMGEGRAHLYYGSATGLTAGPAAWIQESDQEGAWFGFALGTAGDVNGDGYDDVVIGAPHYTGSYEDQGMAYLYYGSSGGLGTGPAGWMLAGDQPRAKLGDSVGAAGDVNGDGYADLVIGADQYDNGQDDEGLVLIYYGSATGLEERASWAGEGNQVSAGFGFSAAGAGDVNQDGADDVIVGAWMYDGPLTNEGQAFLFYGSQQPARPVLQLVPGSLGASLIPGQTLTRTLRLRNTGTGSVRYDLGPGVLVRSVSGANGWQPIQFPLEKVEPGLRDKVKRAPGEQGTFLVYLKEQADLSGAYQIRDWTERGRYVQQQLWATARKSQAPLQQYLGRQVQVQAPTRYRSFYMVNALLVTARAHVLDDLAARPDVAYIQALRQVALPEPIAAPAAETADVPSRLRKIGASRVWDELGVRGRGIVVANIDTGVEHTHSALAQQYRGTQTGGHDYNWFDATGTFPTMPGDDNGHGTHTMGVMVGDDGRDRHVGVAPAAQWIAAKGCTAVTCIQSDLLAAAEWVLAPYPIGGTPAGADPDRRPHIVNNSWGGYGGDLWFQAALSAWRAAGILPAFAAGNCQDGQVPPCPLASPGDYAGSLSSGAIETFEDGVYEWSCRGPSRLTDKVKPDVSAPGGAWSAGLGSRYSWRTGTSVASPHTAGCAALVLSANPALGVEAVEQLLTSTAADLGAPGPDYDYGYGRIDCYAAAARALLPWLSAGPASGVVPAGGTLDLAVAFDASGLEPAVYEAALPIHSNDPTALRVDLPLTMIVHREDGAGQVNGVVTAAHTGMPLAATVSALVGPYAVETDPGGGYTLWLEAGSHVLQVAAAGHVPQTAGVEVVAGQTTTLDFGLIALVPDPRYAYLPLVIR